MKTDHIDSLPPVPPFWPFSLNTWSRDALRDCAAVLCACVTQGAARSIGRTPQHIPEFGGLLLCLRRLQLPALMTSRTRRDLGDPVILMKAGRTGSSDFSRFAAPYLTWNILFQFSFFTVTGRYFKYRNKGARPRWICCEIEIKQNQNKQRFVRKSGKRIELEKLEVALVNPRWCNLFDGTNVTWFARTFKKMHD